MRIKDKVGIERTETLVFEMCLRVDYPNLQQQVQTPPTIKGRMNAGIHCFKNKPKLFFSTSTFLNQLDFFFVNNAMIALQAISFETS